MKLEVMRSETSFASHHSFMVGRDKKMAPLVGVFAILFVPLRQK